MTKNGPWNVIPTAKNLAVRARSYAGITPSCSCTAAGAPSRPDVEAAASDKTSPPSPPPDDAARRLSQVWHSKSPLAMIVPDVSPARRYFFAMHRNDDIAAAAGRGSRPRLWRKDADARRL